MEIQKLLPQSSFIPFSASRLTQASVVYVNLSLFHEYNYFKGHIAEDQALYDALLDEFAYIVPVTQEDRKLVCNIEKEFLAERYGGVGILANGGGARCGLSGPLQVKGIGPTPVVGEGVNFWYSHGGMALQDALAELIYSHAAGKALPYKSSRVLAVIDTGGYVMQRAYKKEDEDEDEHQFIRRALLIRESAIRPAHFARAFYFKPSSNVKENYPHDYQRVADAIPLLPQLAGIELNGLSKGQRYYAAIEQVVCRAAVQLAYSKVRRFMHGSLTTSNFLIDGGWIDFGSATAVPAYDQLFTAAQQPAFWDEFGLFEKTTVDLCFYVSKYQPDVKSTLGDGSAIYKKFIDIYVHQLRLLFVELTGFPLIFVGDFLNNPEYERLGTILLHIARNENPIHSVSEWVLQCNGAAHKWKNTSLRSILNKLFYAYWIANEKDIPELPFKIEFSRDLWDAYTSVCALIEGVGFSRGVTRQSLAKFVGLNMGRQMIGFKRLYRGQVLAGVRRITEDSASPDDLSGNVRSLYRTYDSLVSLHYGVSMADEVLIFTNAQYMHLYWNFAMAQYRLDVPESVVEEICSLVGGNSLSLVINDRVLFISRSASKVGTFSVCFGSSEIQSLRDIEFALLKGDKSLRLMDFFPENKELYLSYSATFDGKAPPLETKDNWLA